jgi:hypothetical protein
MRRTERASSVHSAAVLALAALTAAACGGNTERLTIEPLEGPFGASVDSAASSTADPAIGFDRATGAVVMTWLAGGEHTWSLWSASSRDLGTTWSTPVRVFRPAADLKPHPEAAPRLVVGGNGRLAVVWTSSVTVEGRQWPASDIRFSRSMDGGATWSVPITLNDDTARGPSGHTFHGAMAEGEVGIVVAWLDERRSPHAVAHQGPDHASHGDASGEDDATIFVARSEDFGATWTPANQPLWGDVCPCCRIALARTPNGRVLGGWRMHLPGNVRDIVVSDLAAAPAAPRRVHPDEWVIDGCPHTGPALDVETDGATHVFWFSGKEGDAGVFYARAEQGGAFGGRERVAGGDAFPVTHPALAGLGAKGALAAYDAADSGARRLVIAHINRSARVAARLEVEGTDGADHPQLVAVDGNTALVAYAVPEGMARLLRIRVR